MMNDNFDIYALLLKQHYEQLTPEEEKEVEARLAADPQLRLVQQEIQAVPKEEAQAFIQNIDGEGEKAKALKTIAAQKSRRLKIRRVLTAAASAAVIVGAYFFLKPDNTISSARTYAQKSTTGATLTLGSGEVIEMNSSGAQNMAVTGANVSNTNRSLAYQLSPGEKNTALNAIFVPARLDFKVTLSDSTIVWLNSTTRFRFPFSFGDNTREVYLDEGEAFFEVAASASRPFLVHTTDGTIKVLGTTFNVNNYSPGKVITSLVSGKVQFALGKQSIEIKPGNEVIAEKGELTKNQNFDQENTLSWRQGIHYFDNVTVKEVGVMLKRWFDVNLIIDNEQAAATEIRGKLNRNQPLDIFLDQVNGTKLVTFYWANNELHCK